MTFPKEAAQHFLRKAYDIGT